MRRVIGFLLLACLVGLIAPVRGVAGDYSVVYRFKGFGDGAIPTAPLIDLNNTLYGTTYDGGGSQGCTHGCGTVFALTAAGERVIYAFKGGTEDGAGPLGGVIAVGDALYGTTSVGGAGGCGTVFSLNAITGAELVLYSFRCGIDGANPYAGLFSLNGLLYGTTLKGGDIADTDFGLGTVFSVDPATGSEVVLHAFNPTLLTDGTYPEAGLIEIDGTLYGTTLNGGTNFAGTVFAVDPTTGTEQIIHSFTDDSSDGAYPQAGLLNVGDILYGVTGRGGNLAGVGCDGFGCGTVFSLNPVTGAEQVLYRFEGGSDGSYPAGSLIESAGALYGTTDFYGNYKHTLEGYGTIFMLNPSTGKESVMRRFQGGSDGANPVAALLDVGGTLYGTTPFGGIGQNRRYGTVFALTP